mmetsp:Transcript_28322/g.45482  ORF Transcript_28322/g.45482 Transcript_28322/m.45482 type:complete len:141 (-) Transcript_28322:61-483(-)
MPSSWPQSGVYSGSYTDDLGEHEDLHGSEIEFARQPSYDSQAVYHARTEYTLTLLEEGSFRLSRKLRNDCEQSNLEEIEEQGSLLASETGTFQLSFKSAVHEKMVLESAGMDDSLKLKALVEGAGPGAGAHDQDIVLRRI